MNENNEKIQKDQIHLPLFKVNHCYLTLCKTVNDKLSGKCPEIRQASLLQQLVFLMRAVVMLVFHFKFYQIWMLDLSPLFRN